MQWLKQQAVVAWLFSEARFLYCTRITRTDMKAGFFRKDTAVREVLEESGASVKIVKYIGDTQYTFNTVSDTIKKTVHWYLDNQEWLDNVASGDYQKYYEKMYAE